LSKYIILKYTLTGDVSHIIIYIGKRGDSNMSIASDMIRGHTETIILRHLLQRDSYGYEINKLIQEKTDNQYELKEATLYSAFRRLEQSGYIISYWGDETTGARRRYYSITPDGRVYYKRCVEEWETAKILIDKLIK
jgi:PadR family transcriptional regulator PadR